MLRSGSDIEADVYVEMQCTREIVERRTWSLIKVQRGHAESTKQGWLA